MSQEKPQPSIPDGDPNIGKELFTDYCGQCHALTGNNESHEAAPYLKGIVGRPAASTNFKFSKPFKESKVIWTEQNLFEFMKFPQGFIKGARHPVTVVNEQNRDRKSVV